MSEAEISGSRRTSRELPQYLRELQRETILWLLLPPYLGAAVLLEVAPLTRQKSSMGFDQGVKADITAPVNFR